MPYCLPRRKFYRVFDHRNTTYIASGWEARMIAASDVEFHLPDADEPNWAETNFFGFYNADRRLNIGVYALFGRTCAPSTRRSA